MEAKKNTALKTVSIVMVIMLIGKIVGLLRSVIIASYLGDSMEADAFFLASKIPRDFLDFAFASAISSSFIPIFNSYIEKKGKKEAYRLANNFITIIFALSLAITLIAMIFSEQIVGILAPGFNAEKTMLTSQLLLIMLPTIVVTALAFSVTGILQSLDEFNVPAAMSVVSNLIIIVYLLFFMDKFGIVGLAIAFLIGWSTQLLIQIPSLLKKEYYYRPYIDLKDSGIKQIGALVIPVMISSWVFPINSLVNVSAVSVKDSWVSALNYANDLYLVITGVLILSISNVIFPKLSKHTVKDDESGFAETMRQTLRVLFFLLLPMTVGLFVLREPIVSLFYERGKFTKELTSLTSGTLMFYSVGMLGFGVQTILSRGFYANKNGRIPLITGIMAIAVNAALSFWLVNILGVGGPALATSISITFTAIIMLIFMYRRNSAILNKQALIDFLKMIFISLSLGVVVYLSMWLLNMFVSDSSFLLKAIKLAVCVGMGVIWYIIVCYLAKIEEAGFVFSVIAKRLPLKKEDNTSEN